MRWHRTKRDDEAKREHRVSQELIIVDDEIHHRMARNAYLCTSMLLATCAETCGRHVTHTSHQVTNNPNVSEEYDSTQNDNNLQPSLASIMTYINYQKRFSLEGPPSAHNIERKAKNAWRYKKRSAKKPDKAPSRL